LTLIIIFKKCQNENDIIFIKCIYTCEDKRYHEILPIAWIVIFNDDSMFL
jgi:hypothetical protein